MVAARGQLPDMSNGLWYYEDVREKTRSPARPKGISRKTFDNWTERGDLLAWHMGGFVVTTPDAFTRFLVPVEVANGSENAESKRREEEEGNREVAEALAMLDAD